VIAIDTSVLIRYVTQDDPKQSRQANRLFESTLSESYPGYLSLLVLAEFHWVLRRRYGFAGVEIAEAIRRLLAVPTIVVDKSEVVEAALVDEAGDFADRLIHYLGAAAGCERTLTFDRKFARLPGVEVVKSS